MIDSRSIGNLVSVSISIVWELKGLGDFTQERSPECRAHWGNYCAVLVIETEGTGSGNSWDMRRASLENKSRLDPASLHIFLYWSLEYNEVIL